MCGTSRCGDFSHPHSVVLFRLKVLLIGSQACSRHLVQSSVWTIVSCPDCFFLCFGWGKRVRCNSNSRFVLNPQIQEIVWRAVNKQLTIKSIMFSCSLHLLQYSLRTHNCCSRWLKHVNILSVACLLPFKQSPEPGDLERNGYWSYTKPLFPTQNTGKKGLGLGMSRAMSQVSMCMAAWAWPDGCFSRCYALITACWCNLATLYIFPYRLFAVKPPFCKSILLLI